VGRSSRIVADPITHTHELIGVVKGVVQVCLEHKLVFECRGLTACACKQRSSIEEAFIQYNAAHNTSHRCLFLPKFHPELNLIERILGRMKYYIRINCDNTFPTLKTNIEAAMEPFNLPLEMIRR